MAATTTLIGNTTDEIELRYTQNGQPVANLTIAVADRRFNKQTNQYEDGNTWFARCTIWGDMAPRAAESIPKGTRVIASGKVGQCEWEDRDGNKRMSVEVTLDEIGPSVKYATAQVTRAPRQGGGQQPAGGSQNGSGYSNQQNQNAGGWVAPGGGQAYEDTPPF